MIPQPIRAHQTQLPQLALKHIKNTIAVASGKGGVGKSTVAVNLAVALAKLGARVGVLDADIYGPSIPRLMGINRQAEVQEDRYVPIEQYQVHTMSIAYITAAEQALIWRGPMLAKALIQMLDGTAWHDLDYLIIDLPPGTGDIQLSLVQKIPITAALVVSTPQAIATLDASKAIQMFQTTHVHVLGLVENMAGHACAHCGHQEAVFGQGGVSALCKTYDLPLLASLPLDVAIQAQSDAGIPTASQPDTKLGQLWTALALNTANLIAERPVNFSHRFPPIHVE